MKVAVYAVLYEGYWSLWISIAVAVDSRWWCGDGRESEGWNKIAADRMVVLSPSIPLSWALKLRDCFIHSSRMQTWGSGEWGKYISDVLMSELKDEMEAGGAWREERIKEGVSLWQPVANGHSMARQMKERYERNKITEAGGIALVEMLDGQQKIRLGSDANLLAEAVAGRSLLSPELEALLSEQQPELAGHWRSAAQLAHLQGRLKLEAAVAFAAPAAGARPGALQPLRAAGGLARAAAWLPHLLRRGRGPAGRRALPRCRRCGSGVTGRTACAACGLAGCAYCEACLALGRSRACALLLRSAALPAVRCTAESAPAAARRWGLSAAQAGAAGAALGFLAEPRVRSAGASPERFLLWAVTGAGKTEMLFPLLEAVLAAGGRALVATPRRDVVLELAPRLGKAFPEEAIAVLYGGSPERWVSARLTLATTHQLLRFHQGFDLVIIDELDAFPYHNDPMLAFAAGQACKPEGSFIFLSATPPTAMQRQANSGKMQHARVPVRFHGHPLPVPRHLNMPPVHTCLKRGGLPKVLVQALRRSLHRNAQIFVFVSRIAHIEGLLQLLRRSFPDVAIEGTSSQDSARADKVAAFRSRTISMLVTTTILERGVTVPKSDVFVLDADSSLFDEASLVQMAGRAGRSKDDPAGGVIFASSQWNRSQRGAISQIRRMNAIARQKGYLRKEES